MRVPLTAMYVKERPHYRRFISSSRRAPTAEPEATNHLHVDAIKYLAMEGGGGKGCAYLGAIIALEELGLLPIRPDGTSRIRGIAGASAGTITAFLLALGLRATDLWGLTRAAAFRVFLDPPAHGRARCATFQDDPIPMARVANTGGAKIKTTTIEFDPDAGQVGQAKMLLALVSLLQKENKKGFADNVAGFIAHLLEGRVATSKSKVDDHVFEAIKRDPGGYLRNLLSDPGIFPGFAVRDFFARHLFDRLVIERSQGSALYNGSDQALLTQATHMTFREFCELTKLDFIVAATSLTTGRPAYFSLDTTPEFPVIEAVGTSMSIPMFFKPVYIDTEKDTYDAFKGWWADGGIVNNYPLHAFNEDAGGGRPAWPHERNALPLNPATLGLTLEEPDLTPFGVVRKPPPDYPSVLGMISPVMDALMFSSTEGQIRTDAERRHTIRLKAYFINTYDLVPDRLVAAASVPEARTTIHRAFGKRVPLRDVSPTYVDIEKQLTRERATLSNATSTRFVTKVMHDIIG